MNDKPICLIPARSGSKRIKNKNIKHFAGKPLIGHVIKIAKKSNIFSRIIVSTDSKKIAKIAKYYGAEIPFIRKKKLSGDFTTTKRVIIDCIKKLSSQNTNYHFCLYPTAPLILEKDLVKSLKVIKKTRSDQLIATCEYDYSPLRALRTINKKVKFFWPRYSKKRSQDLPKLLHDSGTFYIFKTKNLLKEKNILSKKTVSYSLDRLRSIDIDNYEDFKFAVFLYKYLKKVKKNK